MTEAAEASRRYRYLQAMQVDVWLRRDRHAQACAETTVLVPG
jgi:hypothetical protein